MPSLYGLRSGKLVRCPHRRRLPHYPFRPPRPSRALEVMRDKKAPYSNETIIFVDTKHVMSSNHASSILHLHISSRNTYPHVSSQCPPLWLRFRVQVSPIACTKPHFELLCPQFSNLRASCLRLLETVLMLPPIYPKANPMAPTPSLEWR